MVSSDLEDSDVNKFYFCITEIMRRQVSGGQFNEEIVLPDGGGTVTHSCCWATGMMSSIEQRKYSDLFGLVPEWVRVLHPYHRGCLCKLAVESNLKLPVSMPQTDVSLDGKSGVGAEKPGAAKAKTRSKKSNPLYQLIRDAVLKAASEEAALKPFNLSGRGHEPRVTLDRKMASILKDVDLPRVHISGFGANNHYPYRVLKRAADTLSSELGWSPIMMYQDREVYFSDKS